MWMAVALARTNMVSVSSPKCFNRKSRNALRADPMAVKLRNKNAFFYELGLDVATLVGDSELPSTLRRVLAVRYGTIFDTSTSSLNADVTKLKTHFTNLERAMFEAGYASSDAQYKWKTRKLATLKVADVIERARKRRRLNF